LIDILIEEFYPVHANKQSSASQVTTEPDYAAAAAAAQVN